MNHIVVAAAVPEGALVKLGDVEFQIDDVENSKPIPGRIQWTNPEGQTYNIGGNVNVEVISFDRPQEG